MRRKETPSDAQISFDFTEEASNTGASSTEPTKELTGQISELMSEVERLRTALAEMEEAYTIKRDGCEMWKQLLYDRATDREKELLGAYNRLAKNIADVIVRHTYNGFDRAGRPQCFYNPCALFDEIVFDEYAEILIEEATLRK